MTPEELREAKQSVWNVWTAAWAALSEDNNHTKNLAAALKIKSKAVEMVDSLDDKYRQEEL